MILTRSNVIFMGNNIKWSCPGLREYRSLRCNTHNPRRIRPETGNQCSVRETRPTLPRVLTVIFATTISRSESDHASEYLRRKTENRVLGDLEGPVTFEEKTRGFRTAAVAVVHPRSAPPPCPAAFRRRRTTTDARPGREAPSPCRKKKRYISPGSLLPWRVTNTYGIITFPNRSRTMSCTTIGGANGSRDKLADPNSAVL